jgi:hypothetical protein
MNRRKRIFAVITGFLIFILFISGAYTTWNRLDPEYTCAQCHEVSPAHARWTTSAHAEVSCTDCHGTALSDGYHSLSEKTGMVVSHMRGGKYNDDITLSEEQALKISEECMKCHRSEHAGWLAGGHAVNYKEIFMDSVHNAMEKPYWDCFRCHGMFYDGNIHDLMCMESDNPGDWVIRDKKQEEHPAVPCLACHRMHTGNPVSMRYVSMTGDTARATLERHPKTALYVRADREYLRSDMLTPVVMFDGERIVESAADPATLLCIQCHSPNFSHRAGSEDDRTVTGVHEGISCIACHNPHSGETKSSCIKCHPSLTGEQIKAVFDSPHTYKTENSDR